MQGRASISMALAADSNIMLHGLLQPDCPEPSGPQLSPVELVVMEGISALLGQLPASWRGELALFEARAKLQDQCKAPTVNSTEAQAPCSVIHRQEATQHPARPQC